jgi:hypothetical protein
MLFRAAGQVVAASVLLFHESALKRHSKLS